MSSAEDAATAPQSAQDAPRIEIQDIHRELKTRIRQNGGPTIMLKELPPKPGKKNPKKRSNTDSPLRFMGQGRGRR